MIWTFLKYLSIDNYFGMIISGYQWWFKSSLIAIDCLIAKAVNLSALAGAPNMHATARYAQIGGKILFSILLKNIFFNTTEIE